MNMELEGPNSLLPDKCFNHLVLNRMVLMSIHCKIFRYKKRELTRFVDYYFPMIEMNFTKLNHSEEKKRKIDRNLQER